MRLRGLLRSVSLLLALGASVLLATGLVVSGVVVAGLAVAAAWVRLPAAPSQSEAPR